MERKPYPNDDEWAFVAPYLTLMCEEAPQREHDLREVFHGLRWIVRTDAPWRMMSHDPSPWAAVYQQTRAPGGSAGVFEAIVADLRGVLRLAEGRNEQSSATILGSRTLQSSPESGHRAGYDGAKRRKGSKVHLVVEKFATIAPKHVHRCVLNEGKIFLIETQR